MRRPDPITNPLVVGNVDAGIIYSAIQPLDQIANEMECKWGVGQIGEVGVGRDCGKVRGGQGEAERRH
jgi:hypothetical protein